MSRLPSPSPGAHRVLSQRGSRGPFLVGLGPFPAEPPAPLFLAVPLGRASRGIHWRQEQPCSQDQCREWPHGLCRGGPKARSIQGWEWPPLAWSRSSHVARTADPKSAQRHTAVAISAWLPVNFISLATFSQLCCRQKDKSSGRIFFFFFFPAPYMKERLRGVALAASTTHVVLVRAT